MIPTMVSADMMPRMLRNEPIEKIEPNDPMEPMENAEPRDPIERTEFFDQRLSTEFSDLYDSRDSVPVLCRVLMCRVCHVGECDARKPPGALTNANQNTNRESLPFWGSFLHWRSRWEPSAVHRTASSQIPALTNQANKKDSRTWESFLLAVPVGFEFSSYPRPVLGESEISPETGHC